MMFARSSRALAMAVSAAIGLATALSGTAAWAAEPVIVQRVTDASADGPVVVAIGDSVMEGHGLDADQAWPALLAQRYGWRLTNLASDGSGFVTVGNNGDTLADQVAVAARLHPSIVLIAGSSNDLGQPDALIASDTDSTMRALRADLPDAQIVVVSPVWNQTTQPTQLGVIGQDAAAAAALVGAVPLNIGTPLKGHDELMQSDDVHPTAVGQRVIAHRVARALASTASA